MEQNDQVYVYTYVRNETLYNLVQTWYGVVSEW